MIISMNCIRKIHFKRSKWTKPQAGFWLKIDFEKYRAPLFRCQAKSLTYSRQGMGPKKILSILACFEEAIKTLFE
jgi:hypothetical protein